MRILLLVTQNDLGGAQQYVISLARAFRDRAEVMIAVGKDGDGWLTEAAKKEGIPTLEFPNLRRAINLRQDLATVREFRKLLLTKQWDVIHANSTKAGVLLGIARLLSRSHPLPRSIYTAHGWAFLEPLSWSKKILYWLLECIAARGRDTTIILSEKEMTVARQVLCISQKKIFLIPHGLPPSHPTPKEEARALLAQWGVEKRRFTTQEPLLGVIANFFPTKGIDVLFQALATPALVALPWTVLLIGDGPERALLTRLHGNHPRKKDILLLGQHDRASRVLPALDAFLLPSRKEGLPFALLEALDAGLPIIATHVGGVPEAVSDAGSIVPPGDVDALADAIVTLLTDQKRRTTYATNAKKKGNLFHEQYAHMLEKTWGVYQG